VTVPTSGNDMVDVITSGYYEMYEMRK